MTGNAVSIAEYHKKLAAPLKSKIRLALTSKKNW